MWEDETSACVITTVYIGHTNVTHLSLKCAQTQTIKKDIFKAVYYVLFIRVREQEL